MSKFESIEHLLDAKQELSNKLRNEAITVEEFVKENNRLSEIETNYWKAKTTS